MPLLLGLLLLAGPSKFSVENHLETQEALNDDLELRFNAICDRLKDGARTMPVELADADAFPKPKSLVWVRTCSLRALKLELTGGDERPVHLWWELEGRDSSGG